jgi:hypothetical protein
MFMIGSTQFCRLKAANDLLPVFRGRVFLKGVSITGHADGYGLKLPKRKGPAGLLYVVLLSENHAAIFLQFLYRLPESVPEKIKYRLYEAITLSYSSDR